MEYLHLAQMYGLNVVKLISHTIPIPIDLSVPVPPFPFFRNVGSGGWGVGGWFPSLVAHGFPGWNIPYEFTQNARGSQVTWYVFVRKVHIDLVTIW